MEKTNGPYDMPGDRTATRKRRLMIVDDDLDVLPLYEIAGESEDTLLTIQTGALSALKHLDALGYQVDAVILDLSMPDMDGIALTRQIRRNEEIRGTDKPIKIFWFTGYPINDTINAAGKQYKITEIFQKPESPVDIVNRVKQYLH